MSAINGTPQTVNDATTGATCSWHSRCTALFSGSGSSNMASQQFELSKNTFRWTSEWAEINFNRLKILILPCEQSGNFPRWGTSQSKSVGRSESHTEKDLTRFTVHYTAFCCPALHLGQMEAQAQSPVSLRLQTFGFGIIQSLLLALAERGIGPWVTLTINTKKT